MRERVCSRERVFSERGDMMRLLQLGAREPVESSVVWDKEYQSSDVGEWLVIPGMDGSLSLRFSSNPRARRC
jgi:hypothetical protein